MALALAAAFVLLAYVVDPQSAWQIAAVLVALFVVIAVAFDLLLFRPINALVRRSRARLSGDYERNDPFYRDEARELGYLVRTLIAVFTASKDKEWVAQSIKDDLMRVQALNRQLMDVGVLGREMNAALPYLETVERVLSRSRTFLHADFGALLLLDSEARAFSLEGKQGVITPTLSAECCAYSPDCPVRQAIASGKLTRVEGHVCTLFPHTMTHQMVIPVKVENVGDMALLTTSTSGEYAELLTDDILGALQNHVQSALTNAHKYDAIRRQVVTDHLTGLYNRRYFMNRAGEEIERSLRHQEPLSVLMVDIDHFKQFNDTYGHATGDRVLQTVARAMKDVLRKPDICARHGGEEFAVLLPSTPGDAAYFVADRIRRTLGGTRYTGLGLPPEANVTISVGVATCPRDATVLDELMELADKALYRAKADGRDTVVLWGAEERERVRI
ncbi:MAG TPA: GGDEF domain-containing protein [Thermoleophilia bacterium]|nr:GGDEF domain-containing protein [Thermoleophilia bacterium]